MRNSLDTFPQFLKTTKANTSLDFMQMLKLNFSIADNIILYFISLVRFIFIKLSVCKTSVSFYNNLLHFQTMSC